MPRPRYAALVLWLAVSGLPMHAQSPSIEYDVKAAFLLNFTRYVEWPGSRKAQQFDLCTLEPDPFGRRLEAAVIGEQWDGHAISVRRLHDGREAKDCHLLFVPAAATARFHTAQHALEHVPLLTVGESRDFLARGGMIQMDIEGNRVRFSINQAAAESAGLRISSRLLRLARAVTPEGGAP